MQQFISECMTETGIFVVKMIQIQDYIKWIARFVCLNWGQIDILGKIINGHNSRFSIREPFMFKIQTYWIISVSIFEQYIFNIHWLWIKSAIARSRIKSYCILSVFCLRSAILPIPDCNWIGHQNRTCKLTLASLGTN